MTKLSAARQRSAFLSRERKAKRKESAFARASGFEVILSEREVRKIMLGALYLAEGTKGDRGALTFGNSNPEIIKLFLSLMRSVYVLDESKFRCTIQARASQDTVALERFWSECTGIPPRQFYSSRIDPRSKGKETKREGYKGVCRLDYLSTELLYEVLAIGRILTERTGL